jgi:cation/acetate symporter
VLLACALGTMGLPHVIVRLHVSLDGHEARRSIVAAQAMLALFCVVPPLYGVLSAVQPQGGGWTRSCCCCPPGCCPGRPGIC